MCLSYGTLYIYIYDLISPLGGSSTDLLPGYRPTILDFEIRQAGRPPDRAATSFNLGLSFTLSRYCDHLGPNNPCEGFWRLVMPHSCGAARGTFSPNWCLATRCFGDSNEGFMYVLGNIKACRSSRGAPRPPPLFQISLHHALLLLDSRLRLCNFSMPFSRSPKIHLDIRVTWGSRTVGLILYFMSMLAAHQVSTALLLH